MSRAPTRALRGSGRRCGGEFRWISDGGRPSRRGFEEIRSAFQALIALDLPLDLKLRKNEAKRLGFGREVDGGIEVTAFVLRELEEQACFFFGFGDGGFALGLEGV